MKIFNKKARFDYNLFDRFEAGIVLLGSEVKSVKNGHATLSDAFAKIISGELYLINANISPYPFADNEKYEPKKTRKLLIKKSEILSLTKKIETKNYALIPTAIYTKKNRIKVEVSLAKGKKQFEKREAIKKHDQQIEQARILKKY